MGTRSDQGCPAMTISSIAIHNTIKRTNTDQEMSKPTVTVFGRELAFGLGVQEANFLQRYVLCLEEMQNPSWGDFESGRLGVGYERA